MISFLEKLNSFSFETDDPGNIRDAVSSCNYYFSKLKLFTPFYVGVYLTGEDGRVDTINLSSFKTYDLHCDWGPAQFNAKFVMSKLTHYGFCQWWLGNLCFARANY